MLILTNARFYTLDAHHPRGNALAIENGRIQATGDAEELLARYPGPGTVEDLGGRVVLPGLTDAHIHLENYALSLQKLECELPSRQEVLRTVAEKARQTPPGEWILGHGWNQNSWSEGFGSATDLDAAAPDHPVYLTAKSLHAGWANSQALRRAEISASTPDPQDGRLGRLADGQPDGILYESAMGLVASAIPAPTETEIAAAIRKAQSSLWRMGLTGVHDFDRRRCFAALQSLHAAGELRLRVLKSLPLEDLPHAVAIGLQSGFGDDWLRIGSIKAFADGALGPHTAAMLQPYDEEPQNRGMLLLDAEELYEHGRLAVANGLSLAVHAIGDRANHEVLVALRQLRTFEHEINSDRKAQLRHRIEHVQVIHPGDAGQLAELGVIASMQPIHAMSDMQMADRYWGPRAALSYAWRTQLQAGAHLAFGSDAPVESPNPWWGLHAAVTRQRRDGSPDPQGWYPEQKLSFQEALHAYTTGAAYAAGIEGKLGKLSAGYLADLIVMDEDPFKVEPGRLAQLAPTATMVGGEWVYQG